MPCRLLSLFQFFLSYININTIILLSFSVTIFDKANSISIYASAVPCTVIRREHPGCEELIDSAVLWEDITAYFRQPLTIFSVTALTATEGQFTDFILCEKRAVGYIIRTQISQTISIHFVTDSTLRNSWCDKQNLSFAFFTEFITVVTNLESEKGTKRAFTKGIIL